VFYDLYFSDLVVVDLVLC